MDLLTRILGWLNALANALGTVFLAPIAHLPGWLSATLVAAVTGVLLLLIFKYTSNQRAIKAVRSDIKANLLALKLFPESARVALQAQGRVLIGAFKLMLLAIVPIVVMTVPVLLFLGQMGAWYQAKPLPIGKETVLTVKLNGDTQTPWPDVQLQPTDAVKVTLGPVRVQSKRELCWQIKAEQPGYHRMVVKVDGQEINKELAVGDGFMRVSAKRPGGEPLEILENPREPAFLSDSPVGKVEIAYPERDSWTSGTNKWIIFWFIVSMVAAFLFRGALGVNI